MTARPPRAPGWWPRAERGWLVVILAGLSIAASLPLYQQTAQARAG
ncbi:MAG: hypothetical protein ACYCZV_09470 [Acidimicrobiales bacterium]